VDAAPGRRESGQSLASEYALVTTERLQESGVAAVGSKGLTAVKDARTADRDAVTPDDDGRLSDTMTR
jgi:hypothetical protein